MNTSAHTDSPVPIAVMNDMTNKDMKAAHNKADLNLKNVSILPKIMQAGTNNIMIFEPIPKIEDTTAM